MGLGKEPPDLTHARGLNLNPAGANLTNSRMKFPFRPLVPSISPLKILSYALLYTIWFYSSGQTRFFVELKPKHQAPQPLLTSLHLLTAGSEAPGWNVTSI